MKPKALVISFSSLTAINRKVYGLLADRYDVRLIMPSHASVGSSVKEAEPAGEGDPDLIGLPLAGNNPRIQYYRGMWKVLKSFKPRYIFLENDPISVLSVICCFYKIFSGSKLLCQTNENLSLSWKGFFSGNVRFKIMLLIKRITCFFTRPFVDHVFAINYEGKEIYEDLNYRRVSWIPLGYSSKIFHQDPEIRNRIRNKLNLNATVIGYFGRIVPQKGLLLLLRALTGLREYPFKLLIDDFSAYKTPYIEEIRSFVDKNDLNTQVVFFHADHQEIAQYMNACDLVVVPSITEGTFKEQYGRVVQEAIACGCITITSDSGFLPHFFQDDIFIFKENNIEAIREKIKFFIEMDKSTKATLLQKSMSYISQYFSIEAQAKVISDAFDQLN